MTEASQRKYPNARFVERSREQVIGVIEEILQSEAGLNGRQDRYESSALLLSVACDRPDLVRRLLTCRAEPNIPDKFGHTPLHEAIGLNLNDLALLILADQRTISSTETRLFDPPLSPRKWAERGGNLAMVELLTPGSGSQMTAVYLIRELDSTLVDLGVAASSVNERHTVTLDADWRDGKVRLGLRATGSYAPQLSAILGQLLTGAGATGVRVEPSWTHPESHSGATEAKAYIEDLAPADQFCLQFRELCRQAIDRDLFPLCAEAATAGRNISNTLVFPYLFPERVGLIAATVNSKLAAAAVFPNAGTDSLHLDYTINVEQRSGQEVTVLSGPGLVSILDQVRPGRPGHGSRR